MFRRFQLSRPARIVAAAALAVALATPLLAQEARRSGSAMHAPTQGDIDFLSSSSGDIMLTAGNDSSGSNVFEKMSDSIKGSWVGEKFRSAGNKLKPKSSKPIPSKDRNDPTSVFGKTPEPNADYYVAVARVHERAGNTQAAIEQYQVALSRDPNSLSALLGMARLHDRQGQLDLAVAQYKQASARHPRESSVLNDLGLCYAKQGNLPDSVRMLESAVQMEPQRKLYRNNIATVLVEMDRREEALRHLQAVQTPAIAHYNVGYLLKEKGDLAAAMYHFNRAIEADGTLVAARQWHDHLAAHMQTPPQVANRPVDNRPTPSPAYRPKSPPLNPGSEGPALNPLVESNLPLPGSMPETPVPSSILGPRYQSQPQREGSTPQLPAAEGVPRSTPRRAPPPLPPVAGTAAPPVSQPPLPTGLGPEIPEPANSDVPYIPPSRY